MTSDDGYFNGFDFPQQDRSLAPCIVTFGRVKYKDASKLSLVVKPTQLKYLSTVYRLFSLVFSLFFTLVCSLHSNDATLLFPVFSSRTSLLCSQSTALILLCSSRSSSSLSGLIHLLHVIIADPTFSRYESVIT